jgi:tetratricopeptide (TPR) repeat protein
MAQARDLSGDDDEAVRYYQQALDVADRVGDHSQADDVLRRLGQFYMKVDRPADAAAAYRDRLDRRIRRMEHGEPYLVHVSLEVAAWDLLNVLTEQGAHDQAESLCREMLALLEDETLPERYAAWLDALPDEMRERYITGAKNLQSLAAQRDQWSGRLGEACLRTGKFAEADSRLARYVEFHDEELARQEQWHRSFTAQRGALVEQHMPPARAWYCREVSEVLAQRAEALRALGRESEATELAAQAAALDAEHRALLERWQMRLSEERQAPEGG